MSVSIGACRAILSATRSRPPVRWVGSVTNGDLLTLASKHFDVFVTVDQNLSFQQNVSSLPIAVIVLRARSNRLADLKPLIPHLKTVLQIADRSSVTFVGGE
jgi:hypothetical protein